MTLPSSTTRSAGSVMLDPGSSSASLSTVSTSSRATFSCLPPQRTIAYTRELPLPVCVPRCRRTWPAIVAGYGTVAGSPMNLTCHITRMKRPAALVKIASHRVVVCRSYQLPKTALSGRGGGRWASGACGVPARQVRAPKTGARNDAAGRLRPCSSVRASRARPRAAARGAPRLRRRAGALGAPRLRRRLAGRPRLRRRRRSWGPRLRLRAWSPERRPGPRAG